MRTCGKASTYRHGCRCPLCKQAQRVKHGVRPCPDCGKEKSRSAARCATCATKAGTPGGSRGTYTVAVFSSVKEHQDPAWRPKHFPPACPACGGFGYVGEPYSRCTTCRAHPGHAVSHAEWAETRP